eukprot:6468524-Amphidinium_carterae.1
MSDSYNASAWQSFLEVGTAALCGELSGDETAEVEAEVDSQSAWESYSRLHAGNDREGEQTPVAPLLEVTAEPGVPMPTISRLGRPVAALKRLFADVEHEFEDSPEASARAQESVSASSGGAKY